VTLVVVAALLVGAGVLASLRFDAIVNRIKDRQVADLSQSLGRPVKVGHIDTHLFSLSVDVDDVSIGADPTRPAETLPVLTLGRLHLAVAGKTLLSLGKRVGVRELRIERLTVNVVKHADGTLNLQNLADSLPHNEPPEPPRPMDEKTRELVRTATLDQLRLTGRVHFVDLARAGAAVDIGQIELALDDVSASKPVTISLGAAVLGQVRNFNLTARVGATPPALDAAPPLERLTVKLARTDLSPLAPFISAAVPAGLGGIESATAALDIDVQPGAAAPGGRGATLARTDIAVTGLRFQRGEPADIKLETDLSGDLAGEGTLDLRRFLLALGSMQLEARGKLAGLRTAPQFSDFTLDSKGFDFDRMRKMLPDLDQRAGAVLRGPFSLWAKANGSAAGQTFDAGLDFTGASIEVPAQFRKPAGTALRIEVRGKTAGEGLDVERFALMVADWRLGARGTVRNMRSPAPLISFTAEAEAPGLGGVLRLLPPVAAGLGGKAKLDGTLALKAKVAGTAAALHAELEARLARLAVKVPDARLGGGGFISVLADKKGKAVDAVVKVDFTALEATYTDVIRKAAGVPLALDVVAAQAAGRQDVKLELRAADLKVSGRAELRPAGDDQTLNGEAIIPRFRVRSLTAMLPALASSPIGDIKAGARIRVKGRVGAPSSMEVTVDDLDLTAGQSDVHGRLALANLDRPRVEMEVKSSYLDVDDFLPPSGDKSTAKKPAGKKSDGDALARVTGRVGLDVTRGKAAGIPYQNLRADLKLVGGLAVANQLEVGVFGGTFSGTGSEIHLLDDREPFTAKGSLKNIDIGAAVTHFAGIPDLLSGRLTGSLAVGGAGTALALLEKTLEGTLNGAMHEVQLFGGRFLEALLAPLAAKVNALPGAGKLLDTASAPFRKLTDRAVAETRTSLAFQRGTLTLARPLGFETASGPLRLDGRVLLGGKWDLTGLLTLTPAAASALTANRISVDQPVPIKLAITGPIAHPKVTPTALDEVAKIYALAFARSAAGQAVRAKLQSGAQELLGRAGLRDKVPTPSVDTAKAQAAETRARAEAEAQAASARARAQADEARAKAEADARAKAEEAKRNASEAAKAKLKGIFGR
jgi:hypothetical protein